jgi:hypothetical protein
MSVGIGLILLLGFSGFGISIFGFTPFGFTSHIVDLTVESFHLTSVLQVVTLFVPIVVSSAKELPILRLKRITIEIKLSTFFI